MSTDFATHVASNPVSRAILSRWDRLDLPGSWLVAGCLFQTVWNVQAGLKPESGPCVTAVVPDSTKARGCMSPADAITRYSTAQSPQLKAVCKALQAEIGAALPKATPKISYAMPVWFVGESPVVGFKASAEHVTLLFWNGQALGDPALIPAGKFNAAQIEYRDASEIDPKALRKWLKKAGTKIWDIESVRRAHDA
jgi:hypothetical protein